MFIERSFAEVRIEHIAGGRARSHQEDQGRQQVLVETLAVRVSGRPTFRADSSVQRSPTLRFRLRVRNADRAADVHRQYCCDRSSPFNKLYFMFNLF